MLYDNDGAFDAHDTPMTVVSLSELSVGLPRFVLLTGLRPDQMDQRFPM